MKEATVQMLSRSSGNPESDREQDDIMKADRLGRKTYLKKISSHAMKNNVQSFDLTETCAYENSLDDIFYPLADIGLSADPTMEDGAAAAQLAAQCQSDEDLLRWAAAMISHSPTASSLWHHAAKHDWALRLTCLHDTGYALDDVEGVITLDHFGLTPNALGRSAYFRNAFLSILVRALRDVWHEEKFGHFEEEFAPEHVLMLERVRAADCDSVTIYSAWELRGAGFGDVWRHLLGSEEGDMAMMFSRFLERDPKSLFDGSALAYTFRQWYADVSRVDGCDHETLENLDMLMEESDVRNPFGVLAADISLIEEMSRLPSGKTYLTGQGGNILHEPYFAGLGDPINQSHFFHLVYDMEVKMVNNVPFRDMTLARKIFPEAEATSVLR